MHLGYARLFAGATLTLLGTACSSVGGSGDDGATYSLGSSACTLTSSLALSTNPALEWSGCSIHYDADSHVVTWQLLPSGGGAGSLLSPAANVIVLSFDRDAAENATFSTANIVSPLPYAVPMNQTVFAYGTSSGRDGGNGTVSVGSNIVNTAGGGGKLSGEVAIKLTSGATLTGSFQAAAAEEGGVSTGGSASDGASSGGGGGGCSDNGASCASTGNCANGGQYACYCAAAATYQCFLEHGCYAEAGAKTSVTKEQLESGCSTSLGQASSLGGGTCGSLSCK